ncbi:MAG: FAD:protein FMN transferase, partial [Methylococcaceae bacterium]
MKQQKGITNSGNMKMEPSGFIGIMLGRRRQYLSKYYNVALFLVMLTACSEQAIQKLEGSAQGTTYHISYWSEMPVDGKAIEASIKNEFDTIDKALSNYRSDSVIETFNSTEHTNSQEVGYEIVSLVRVA